MDPADPAQVRVALEQQGAMLGHHQSHLDTQPPGQTPPGFLSAPPREPRLPPPEKYAGEPGGSTQCQLVFQLQPSTFPTEQSRVWERYFRVLAALVIIKQFMEQWHVYVAPHHQSQLGPINNP
ncbi:hypothetical protein SKAU_G00146100 [Synaphobranchus kaupii]|uniref:Uncharacterized protein n=1 Tax=Synaphobranchus kaupii TaxID=118154 RepID=A0A9Q1J3S3_SYNKA|nr:hypothetical protein SKAU_G00146100 [Synaphobranchus kaupii]